MARLRVTATMKRQLADLRDSKANARKGGVMRVPKILSLAEWEAIAAPIQDKLIEASSEDRARPEPVVMPAPVPTNNNADHNVANRTAGEAARQGGRPYLEQEQERVRQLTEPSPYRPPSQPYRPRGGASR